MQTGLFIMVSCHHCQDLLCVACRTSHCSVVIRQHSIRAGVQCRVDQKQDLLVQHQLTIYNQLGKASTHSLNVIATQKAIDTIIHSFPACEVCIYCLKFLQSVSLLNFILMKAQSLFLSVFQN